MGDLDLNRSVSLKWILGIALTLAGAFGFLVDRALNTTERLARLESQMTIATQLLTESRGTLASMNTTLTTMQANIVAQGKDCQTALTAANNASAAPHHP